MSHGNPNSSPKSPMSRLSGRSDVVVVLVVVKILHVAISSCWQNRIFISKPTKLISKSEVYQYLSVSYNAKILKTKWCQKYKK